MFRGFNVFRDDPFFSTGSSDFPDFDSFWWHNDPRHRQQAQQSLQPPQHQRPLAREQADSAVTPFGSFSNMFGGMSQVMSRMQRRFGDIQQQMQQSSEGDPNCHSYSSSSFYSYDGRGSEPHVYQAHTSTRTAPGGVRETRKAVTDSRSGEEKMEIGQHINERGVLHEMRKNRRTNAEDKKQTLIGMQQDHLSDFTREWQDKAQKFNAIRDDGHRHEHHAVENSPPSEHH